MWMGVVGYDWMCLDAAGESGVQAGVPGRDRGREVVGVSGRGYAKWPTEGRTWPYAKTHTL